jgi:uncharacterized protein YjbI with pentapeptide repeats
MLFLVTPTFFSNFLSQLYATINSVESNASGTIGTVLEQDKLNDEIINIFKKIFPNPNIVFKRLKETEFYTISLDNESDIDFAELEKKHVINSRLHNNLLNPALTLRFNDSVTGQESNMGINKILFNLSTIIENYTPFTDKELYDNGGANIQEMIQNGKQIPGVKLNNLNLNNRNYPGINFSGSDDMNDSQFVNAKLIGANFTDSQLSNARFNNADLRGSDFSVATITRNASFVGADLKFSNFSGADLTGADLSDADLRHANLSAVTLTDCIINENTKIYGATLDDAIYDENFNEANRQQYEDDIEYEASGVPYELEEEKIDYSIEDKLAGIADKTQQPVNAAITIEEKTLSPLVIDPKLNIGDRVGNNYTFEDIVNLLTPKINNVKVPLSHMEINKWYGIASIGNTSAAIWKEVGVDGEPRIGTVFKCKTTPLHEDDEAIVYETVPACMAVHQLSRALNNDTIFGTFLDIVGADELESEYKHITRGVVNEVGKLEISAMLLYKFIVYILTFHTSDDNEESWTHIYDDTEKLKKVVKHAVFNNEEGIMYHPRFDYRMQKSHPQDILLLIMFLESLPYQVQVAWAQNYIKEFIEGYGQSLETFDRTIRSDMGFIASCLNGNLEKFLLSIRTAIIQFYPLELEEETEEGKQNLLKIAVTDSEFQKYFGSIQDNISPTLEGYKIYIQTSASLSEERRNKFLTLLEDPEIVKKIEETISISSGGKKLKRIKRRKTNRYMKSRKHKKTIKKRILCKNKKTIKKRILCKNKKTIKKRI